MQVYVASSFQNRERVSEIMDLLRDKGHTITCDWTKMEAAAIIDRAKEIGSKEVEGVEACNAFILVLPGGVGAHTELGIALGLKKPVWILGTEEQMIRPDGRPIGFYFVRGTHRTDDLNLIIRLLSLFPY